jgi:Retrotransposon gag protein
MFPAAKIAWGIMQRQYPLSWTIERAILGAAFEERSATVYEEVAPAHPQANEQALWGRLESRLFNASQIAIKRAAFEKASQSARETIDEFAQRFQQQAGCLPEVMPEAALCSRFLNGMSFGLRREATVADRGNFDALVSTVARLAAVGLRKTECVSEVQEHPWRPPAFPLGGGTRGSPIRPSVNVPPLQRHAETECFKCHQFGHMATGKFPCKWDPKSKPAEAAAGNE